MPDIWMDALDPRTVRAFAERLTYKAENAKLFFTEIEAWDKSCDDTGGGLDDYWYIVIGGSSNVGKTQGGLSLTVRALEQGFSVVFLTMEEPADQILRRTYAAISNLGYYDFTYDNWSDRKAAMLKVPNLGTMAVNDDLEDESLGAIIGYLNEAREVINGPMIVVLDNLQLIKPRDGRNVQESATDLSEALRKWAKRRKVLTFALSQLTAECIRSGRAPWFADLWGGSAMYSNPSQVIMVDHTAVVVDQNAPHIKRMWMAVAKNRYGPKAAFPIEANLKTGKWREAYPDEHHLWLPNPWEKKRSNKS